MSKNELVVRQSKGGRLYLGENVGGEDCIVCGVLYVYFWKQMNQSSLQTRNNEKKSSLAMDEAASIINIIGIKLEFQGEYARLEGNILDNDWMQTWKKVK